MLKWTDNAAAGMYHLEIGLFELWLIEPVGEQTQYQVQYFYSDCTSEKKLISASSLLDAKRQAIALFRAWLQEPLKQLDEMVKAEYKTERRKPLSKAQIIQELKNGKVLRCISMRSERWYLSNGSDFSQKVGSKTAWKLINEGIVKQTKRTPGSSEYVWSGKETSSAKSE